MHIRFHHIFTHFMHMHIINDVISTVAVISFNQSTYSVEEDSGSFHPVLVLSNPLSSDITLQVRIDGAFSE